MIPGNQTFLPRALRAATTNCALSIVEKAFPEYQALEPRRERVRAVRSPGFAHSFPDGAGLCWPLGTDVSLPSERLQRGLSEGRGEEVVIRLNGDREGVTGGGGIGLEERWEVWVDVGGQAGDGAACACTKARLANDSAGPLNMDSEAVGATDPSSAIHPPVTLGGAGHSSRMGTVMPATQGCQTTVARNRVKGHGPGPGGRDAGAEPAGLGQKAGTPGGASLGKQEGGSLLPVL